MKLPVPWALRSHPVAPTSPPLRLAAVLALAAALPAAVQALPVIGAPQSSVSVQASAGNLAVGSQCGDSVNGTTSASDGCTAGALLPASADVSAAAGHGAVRVGVVATGGSAGSTFGSSGNANASFSDAFAVRGPAGGSGVLRGSIVIAGALTATVTGAAEAPTAAQSSYSVQASVGSWGGASSGNLLQASNGLSQGSNTTGQILAVNAPLTFDPDGWAVVNISVLAQLNANGTARFFQPCSTCVGVEGGYRAEAGFANTIYWGGIDAITVGDTVLTSYDYLASSSGVDYRVSTEFAAPPVPEPAPLALAAGGLALLALRRRLQGASRVARLPRA